MRIPFNKPCLEGQEIENILDSIKSGKIAGDGKYNKLCHEKITEIIGAKKVLLTTSGTDALELCALSYDIKTGDEVIMPSFTFVSTANAFCLRGAKPVFIDIRPDNLNMNEKLIESAITNRTKAVVPVHYAGLACDMDTINVISKKYGLKVIEDAALSFLSTYKGKYLGTFGDMGCFSFHETKTFICGEGGAVVINREEDINRVEILREKGTNRSAFFRGKVDKYTWINMGSSFLPSDIIGAFLYGQLTARDKILSKRKTIYMNYDRMLKSLEDRRLIRVPILPDDCTNNYPMYYLLVDDLATRTKLLEFLQQKGISAVFHYIPLHLSPYAKKLGIEIKLPVTENAAERLIRLPIFNSLTLTEQEYVVENIYNFFKIKFSR